jgi:hypothetical protein
MPLAAGIDGWPNSAGGRGHEIETEDQGKRAFYLGESGWRDRTGAMQQTPSDHSPDSPADRPAWTIDPFLRGDLGTQQGRRTGARQRHHHNQLIGSPGSQPIDGHDHRRAVLARLSRTCRPHRNKPNLAAGGLTRGHRREPSPTRGPRQSQPDSEHRDVQPPSQNSKLPPPPAPVLSRPAAAPPKRHAREPARPAGHASCASLVSSPFQSP